MVDVHECTRAVEGISIDFNEFSLVLLSKLTWSFLFMQHALLCPKVNLYLSFLFAFSMRIHCRFPLFMHTLKMIYSFEIGRVMRKCWICTHSILSYRKQFSLAAGAHFVTSTWQNSVSATNRYQIIWFALQKWFNLKANESDGKREWQNEWQRERERNRQRSSSEMLEFNWFRRSGDVIVRSRNVVTIQSEC